MDLLTAIEKYPGYTFTGEFHMPYKYEYEDEDTGEKIKGIADYIDQAYSFKNATADEMTEFLAEYEFLEWGEWEVSNINHDTQQIFLPDMEGLPFEYPVTLERHNEYQQENEEWQQYDHYICLQGA